MGKFLKNLCAFIIMLTCAGAAHAQSQSPTIAKIQQRGKLLCGYPSGGYLGFFEADDKGNWHGMDADMCRALAVAIFGSADKAAFVPLSWPQRTPALQSGDIDIAFMVSTWTLQRNTELGFDFTLPYLFAGTQFIVKKDLGVTDASQLNGATICTQSGTTGERVALDYLRSKNVTYKVLGAETTDKAREDFAAGRCDVLAGWGPGLATFRAKGLKDPESTVLLPDLLTNELISGMVRQGDEKFKILVTWVTAALIEAEDLGVTSSNVDEMRKSTDPRIGHLLGILPGIGSRFGLRETWAVDVIKSVGNYGEIYERSLGAKSPYQLPRGLNRLWNKGGLLYAPLFD
ncbi:amino acid ABC transporter substrate-binding protein [Aliidongia dinghuensis]|uniref:Amino acid ABC transporter substrate-binding protein n=1 Tax=Aliidongia dinghuensis TaxID=1867774 RepID=A0A8J2Z0X1_9PROT|nr:transporter substrate-binding domain-containing protein [Aliidongia dinghuensis]GGF49115.1 amino acid ABC transporter substrate-binding protein [Aliidongia dinghuensis]